MSGRALANASEDLRLVVDNICAQLCAAQDGSFGFRVRTTSEDHSAQHLAMLANFALASAEDAVEVAQGKERDLRQAHRIARIGTWRHDLSTGWLHWSEEMHTLIGTDPGTFEPDMPSALALVHPDDRSFVEDVLVRLRTSGGATEFEWRALSPTGSLVWFWTQVSAEVDGSGQPLALTGVCQGITERKISAERIHRLAHYDPLTGLANRTFLDDQLKRAIAGLERDDCSVAVLCLDLDGFKGVNDKLGHPAGDELLRQVAQRLRDNVRESDVVGRLGGDEFAVTQVNAGPFDDGTALASRLVDALGVPFHVHGHQLQIGASVGVVVVGEQWVTSDDLMRNADIALYQAKLAGRRTWRLYEVGMDAELHRQRLLETDLRQALAAEQFELYYQPLVEADTQRLTGFEALLRRRHPQRGMISPAEFIPLAEEVDLILPLDAWVLRKACADANRWPDHVKVAVSLSPSQFVKGDLLREVRHALTASGLASHRLELEITESVLLQNNEATLEVLFGLRSLGIGISMDDFGTGYSSLSYLRAFPFDKIKVDQSFVQGLEHEQGSIEIVRAVVGLGKALGMKVLAEGVETVEQRQILRGEGCNELQGYLFSRPMPLAEVAFFLASQPCPAGAVAPETGANSSKRDGQAAA